MTEQMLSTHPLLYDIPLNIHLQNDVCQNNISWFISRGITVIKISVRESPGRFMLEKTAIYESLVWSIIY